MKVNLGQPIAYGRTAEIYAWPNGKVLKLFHDWFELHSIEYELQSANAVQASGLPVPAVGEIIEVNGRKGLIYQRVEGVPMLELMSKRPWGIFGFARRMAQLHADMHTKIIKVDIPAQHERLRYKINHADALSNTLRRKVLAALEAMPAGDRLCHGDFHPGNIMIANGDEVIIDWIDSSLGNPLSDLARTTIITMGAIENGQIPNPFLNIAIRIFHIMYIRRYFSLLPGEWEEYQHWLPIVAAARLSENIPEMEQWLIVRCSKLC